MSLCLYQRILLTTEPIWFSFTMLGPDKTSNYLWKGSTNLQRKITARKNIKSGPITQF